MIRAILTASRPISWVNTAVPFALAYLLDTGRVDWRLCVGFVFFLVPYNIAMYGINDVFDYESDIRNPRKGGIEGAVLPPSMHRPLLVASAVTVAPFAAVLYAAGTRTSAAWLTLALAAVVAYSAPPLRLKEVPILDSATSSTHFVAPALVGASLADATLEPPFTLAAALYLVAALACFALPATGWVVGLLGLGYVANTARYWNVTDATSASVNRAWRVFLWLNYLTGAVVTISVLFLAL